MDAFNLISRQLERELSQHTEAQQRLNSQIREAEDREYASSTIYGQQVLRNATLKVSTHMSTQLKSLGRGRSAAGGATVYNQLKAAKPEVLAVLSLKAMLDKLGGHTDTITYTQLCQHLGSTIEVQLRLDYYRKADPKLYKEVTTGFHKSTGTGQKVTVYKLRFNEANINWETWSTSTKHKVGAWAFNAVEAATGLVSIYTVTSGRRKTATQVEFSREFLGLRDAIIHRAQELAYCLWPMVCPPNPWGEDQVGGYLTEEIRESNPMVRGDFEGLLKQKSGSKALQFLNNLQTQAYQVNRKVMEVAEWAYEKELTIGKFSRLPYQEVEDNFNGDPQAEPDRFKQWKRDKKRAMNYNAQLKAKNWRTTEALFVARKYVDEDVFWLPWSFDYRSRVYPLSIGLSPQGTDFDKSLFLFKEAGPVDEYWLAWHVATTYGRDKLSHTDRVEWTRNNLDLITRVATDPQSTVAEWENLNAQGKPNGEPWCFLAAAIEYHDCCIAKTKPLSDLPIGLDATCSGLQHLSALTLDHEAAKLVNVVRGDEDKPSDGYRTVAEASLKYIEDKTIHQDINRSVTKRTVMTTPYGVSRDSARKYIRSALKEGGVDLSVPGRLGSVTDAVYHKAMPECFAGPVAVMQWLQSLVPELLERGDGAIEWTTPAGFKVRQDIRQSNSVRIRTHVHGKIVASNVFDGYSDTPDIERHKGAIAPNLVHSLDATLLAFLFCEYENPFTVIHDCVLVRSCDAGEIHQQVRACFAEIYSEPVLKNWAESLGVEVPDGLIQNTLNVQDVLDSPYFFC